MSKSLKTLMSIKTLTIHNLNGVNVAAPFCHICDVARSFEARATTKYSIRAQLSFEFVIGRPYKYFLAL